MRSQFNALLVAALGVSLLIAGCTTPPATVATPSTGMTTVAGATAVPGSAENGTMTTRTVAGTTVLPEMVPPPEGTMTEETETIAGTTATAIETPPMAGTPPADTIGMIRMHLDEMQSDMMQMHQQTPPQLSTTDQQQLATLMSDSMRDMAQFMTQMQDVMAQMTPEERDQATAVILRMQVSMGEMMQAMPMETPMPAMTPSGTMPDMMRQMADQMEQMHEMMAGAMQQMDVMHKTQMMAHMSMMFNDMGNLVDIATPALNRMSPSAQQNLLDVVEDMHDKQRAMMRIHNPSTTP